MLPLSVVYFHRVSVASVLLNLWVGFFIALESFAAVIGAIAKSFQRPACNAVFALPKIFNWLMLSVPRLFSDNGWASFRLPAYSGSGRAIYILYFLPILILAFAVNRWKPFDLKQRSSMVRPGVLYPAFAALIFLFGIIVFHPFSAPRPDGRLHFDFLDVGPGRFGVGDVSRRQNAARRWRRTFQYKTRQDEDAEPFEPDVRGIGEAVVSEFLWYRGYSRIDHILATHADADHIQGLSDVAKISASVRPIWTNADEQS